MKPIVGCLLAAMLGPANAEGGFLSDFQKARAEGKSATLVDIDNDTLLLNKNDGFYTSGARFTREYRMRDATQLTTFGWRLGQELYTASDIKLPPQLVGPPDHPYAAWLYGGLFKETYRADGTHYSVGVDAGCLGPCAGGEPSQRFVHSVLRQPEPQGWSKQVKNEPGVVLWGEVAPVRWRFSPWGDATPRLRGRFGNIYTDAGAGVTLRAGQLNVLPDEPTFHGFLRVDGTAVGYNASLQGGYFSSGNPHTVSPKRFVAEAEIGVAWKRPPYGFSAGVVRRGNEIRDLPNSIGAQNFVRLQFSYTP